MFYMEPFFGRPFGLVLSLFLYGTFVAIFSAIALGNELPSTRMAVFYYICIAKDFCFKQRIIRKDGIAEPFATEAVAVALRTDITKGPVQQKTSSIIVIATPLMNENLDPFQLIVT